MAVLHQSRERLGELHVDPDAAVRRRLQRHVLRTVHRDAVVEVDRVEHPAERALTNAVVPAVELEHTAGRVRDAALVALDGSSSRFPLPSVSYVTSSHHSLSSPDAMCAIIAGTSALNTTITCSGR
jgi:hypothetical protein